MSDDYELRPGAGFANFVVGTPDTIGRCSNDWIGEEVPKGGAEEIAALRLALKEQQKRLLAYELLSDQVREALDEQVDEL